MTKRTISHLVTTSALVWGFCGIALIFAPSEIASALAAGPGSVLVVALWGSALFGFGAMNWTARRSPLGGVYGRPVVAANQGHSFVGALVLLDLAFSRGLSGPLAVLLLFYLLHAIFFTYLMFWASGID